jgi:hypothetical protein
MLYDSLKDLLLDSVEINQSFKDGAERIEIEKQGEKLYFAYLLSEHHQLFVPHIIQRIKNHEDRIKLLFKQ